jgi:HrpA-like RNA helicase
VFTRTVVRSLHIALFIARPRLGQVPQFVIEDAAARGMPCNIICTQPRRISAISVAERVAEERGEPCGDVVGYSIRLENKTSARTQLLFCTIGVLLKRLEGDPSLANVTHVFVDEVIPHVNARAHVIRTRAHAPTTQYAPRRL